jgi:hypothetical protein
VRGETGNCLDLSKKGNIAAIVTVGFDAVQKTISGKALSDQLCEQAIPQSRRSFCDVQAYSVRGFAQDAPGSEFIAVAEVTESLPKLSRRRMRLATAKQDTQH